MGFGYLLNRILRFVFSWVDAIIVKMITTIYRLLSSLSELILYNESMVRVLGQRIGLILGIFMLFKIAISLINYLISPDKLSDSKQGGGRLIINVGLSLALLILINPIFKAAYKVQGVVVQSKVIERIFFGNSGILQNKNATDDKEVKMDIGYYLYSGFILPNPEIFGETCDNMWDASYDITLKADNNSKSCDELLYDNLDDEARKSIYKARNTLDMSYIFKDYSLIMEYPQEYVPAFDYTPIISHAAGIIVLLVMISFSMDLATRAIKLLFLQIIAPIPIISNMDMGKGQDIFKKWGKQCINTYLTVFIRLIAINFAVFMIVLLRGNYKDVFVNNVWLNIFLIIGCLMFAKQVPGLIEELLGIKLNGLSLHPLKKFQEQALFGKQITNGVAGLTAGTLAGAAAFGTNWFATQGGLLRKFGGAFAGATSASFRGLGGTLKGQKFGQVYKGAYGGAMTARTNRDDRKELDINGFDVLGQNIKTAMHIPNSSQKDESTLKHLDEISNAGTAAKQKAEAEIDKKADQISVGGQSLGALRDTYEMLKNSAPSMSDSMAAVDKSDIQDSMVQLTGESDAAFAQRVNEAWQRAVNDHFKKTQEQMAQAASEAHAKYFKARKAAVNAYMDHSDNLLGNDASGDFDLVDDNGVVTEIRGFKNAFGTQDANGNWSAEDVVVSTNINKMENVNRNHNMGIEIDRRDIGKAIDAATNRSNSIRNSADHERAQLIQQQAQKEKH